MSQHGRWVEVRIIDQFNSHDILFKEKAKLDREDDVRQLFDRARLKGMDRKKTDAEENKEFLFRED